jgi:hypothetical protein
MDAIEPPVVSESKRGSRVGRRWLWRSHVERENFGRVKEVKIS